MLAESGEKSAAVVANPTIHAFSTVLNTEYGGVVSAITASVRCVESASGDSVGDWLRWGVLSAESGILNILHPLYPIRPNSVGGFRLL